MTPVVRRQRLAEALAAHRATAKRVRMLLGQNVADRDTIQALADTFAVLHGDTPTKQQARCDAMQSGCGRRQHRGA